MLLDLNKFTIGNKQSVGIMSVYPLIAEDEKIDMATFEDITFNGVKGYGTMSFINDSENFFILPTGYAIISKEQAQDHALTFASLLAPKRHTSIENACCVQQTQGGYLSGGKNINFNILPLYIRKKVLKTFENPKSENICFEGNFSRLWNTITSFQSKLTKKSEGNLTYFFEKYLDKLATFNAEFECVPNQRGAIIMINDEIVGVEIVPTHEYWKKIWNSLIRDCYGSEVLRLTELKIIKTFKDSLKNNMDLSKATSIKEIRKLLEETKNEETKKGEDILKEISALDFKIRKNKELEKQNSYKDIKYNVINYRNKVAEVYTENDNLIYLSMLF